MLVLNSALKQNSALPLDKPSPRLSPQPWAQLCPFLCPNAMSEDGGDLQYQIGASQISQE